MSEPLSRRRVLQGLTVGAGAVALGACSPSTTSSAPSGPAGTAGSAAPASTGTTAAVVIPATMGSQRAPVLLGVPTTETPNEAGTRPDPTRLEGTDLLPEIEHIVVLMMENHSFDNYFGMLGRGDGLPLGPDGRPTAANPDAEGRPVLATVAPTTSLKGVHVSQNWQNTHKQYDDGKMDGFATASSPEAMHYFTDEHIPFYWSLAKTFPLCDRWFASVMAQTYPNRRFLQAGTALGNLTTDLPKADEVPPPNGTIFDVLTKHGVSWKNYTHGLPELALWPVVYTSYQDHVAKMDRFVADAAAGTLPAYSVVTPHPNISEENPQDISEGEAFSCAVIDAVMSGPGWAKTVLVFTYDEHGGFYDHVPPPPAFPPDDVEPDPAKTKGVAGHYDRLGMRVPAVIVSPYARKDYVSSVVHDHTSVLRLVETKWNLGALTRRDANASNLLDTLDLDAAPAFATAPKLARSRLEPNAQPTPPKLDADGKPASLSYLTGRDWA